MEGSQLYAEALKARDRGIVTVRLATGTRVTVPTVPVDLGVKFLDFDSVERCLVLDLDARYDIVLGMAWLKRHEPRIDWRLKTLGATHFSPSGALASHEPTSARKQKRFWREHWTETVNVLDVGMSEMTDTESVVDKSPEQSSWAERGVAHNPLSNARGEAASLRVDGGMDRGPERSSWTERGVARKPLSDAHGEAASLYAHEGMVSSEPRHQVCGPNDACVVGQNPLSEARMEDEASLSAKDGMVGVTPKTQGRSPAVECGVAYNLLSGGCGQSSTSLSVGRDTEAPSELEEVMTPGGAADASTTASRRRTTSAKRRREARCSQQDAWRRGCDVDGDATLATLLELDEMSFDEFGEALQAGELAEVIVIRPEEELNSSSLLDEAGLEYAKKTLNARSGSEILKNPFYPVIREYQDVVSKEPLSGLRPDRSVRHEIELVPETKKPNGKWRIVHVLNKLNAATIPAQTPIPRKDVLQNNMVDCTLYSALDLVDGYYQLLMRASDIPLTAVSTPSGMLWERLVMPQGLSNAPATFHRLVTQLFRPHRVYAQTYFDDIFVHRRAELGKTDVENLVEDLRAVLECMRTNKLYANTDKCIFSAEEIPFPGCFIGKRGLRADPATVKAIVERPVPRNQKDLRKWLGLANYLHKYSENYAEMALSLFNLLKKDAEWRWNAEYQHAFEAIKDSLLHAPILALPDPARPFSVVCDTADFAIGCALLQADAEGRERVILPAQSCREELSSS
ncbi:unnamed protein product [Phytophthora fragariaefolia]|uniref:Unnamed protein product n=1 Tax=Phytophthora fragariaefolia TaxID=1490495 RepID=A0A9W6Y9B9_9STRA|nr:unnamed protein product [Phytophthora fragariaefolia]